MKQVLLIIGLILFVGCIGFLVGAIIWTNSLDYTNSRTNRHCKKHHSSTSEGGDCGIWDGSQCRRGKVRNGKCRSAGHPGPFVLLIVSIVALIASIVLLVISFTMKSPQFAQSAGISQVAHRYY